MRISDSEVSLMMLAGNVPLDVTDGYQVMNGSYARVRGSVGAWALAAFRRIVSGAVTCVSYAPSFYSSLYRFNFMCPVTCVCTFAARVSFSLLHVSFTRTGSRASACMLSRRPWMVVRARATSIPSRREPVHVFIRPIWVASFDGAALSRRCRAGTLSPLPRL